MVTLSELFQHTIVINLDRRPDRWHMAQAMMKTAGLNPVRFPATDGSTVDPRTVAAFRRANLGRLKKHEESQKWLQGTVGCLDSHIRALEMAQAEKWPYIYLCEDDAATHPQTLAHVETYLPDVPSDWWSLRVGWGIVEKKTELTENVWRILLMWCTTATVYTAEAIPVLLDIYRRRQRPADFYHQEFDKIGRSYAIVPFAVTQAASQSEIGDWQRFGTSNRNTLFGGEYVRWTQ